jgi:murein DD-endopeptidase MepM/ murein hydrolase activator NlpD
MKKTFALIRLCLAVALCAIGLSAPAAADDKPTATPKPAGSPIAGSVASQLLSMYDVIQEKAAKVASTQSGTNDGPIGGTAVVQAPAAPTVQRAAPQARSYPRTFDSYDALVEYASDVAARQEVANQRLTELTVREDAARATLADVFDPRVRGGLLQSRSDVIDDTSLVALRTQLANDDAARVRLIAEGAVIAAGSPWQIPLNGENTQDFGPTPYWFEPAFTYQGVYYSHFHTGTDIAAPWGSPIVAPAWGVVTFAGTMMDGAEVVVIAHDGGLVSLYAHLENYVFPVLVKAGDTVKAGDQIGNVGLTGITTGAHLHYAVLKDGAPVDPLSLVATR